MLSSVCALTVGCPGEETGSIDTFTLPGTTAGDATEGESASATVGVSISGPGSDGAGTFGSGGSDSVDDSADTGETGESGLADSSSGGAGAECGDNIAEGAEVCDGTDLAGQTCIGEGFEEGTLGCAADCSGYDTSACMNSMCGDGAVRGAEACDGADLGGATCVSEGFESGVLACVANCTALDTSGCGTCGNATIDGDEVCDTADFAAATCVSEGFDGGVLQCAANCASLDTSNCTACGDGVANGGEDCDGGDLDGESCGSLGAGSGGLTCDNNCEFDVSNCGAATQYDVSAPNTSAGATSYFRGHGYQANGDGVLVDFEVYLGLAGACSLDFYVYEANGFGGPYTLLQRTTVNAGPGTTYFAAGLSDIPVTNGMYYVTGVGWNCNATYYWDNSGAFAGVDAGIGIFNVSHWDNAYPGASDLYVPPNTGGGGTVYAHRVFFAG